MAFGRCAGCEARQQTIDILRDLLKLADDRLMILANKPEATSSALADDSEPERERKQEPDEPDEYEAARLAQTAADAVEEWEERQGLEPGSMRDA